MAYKSRKANKRHIAKLWKDPSNWRNIERRRRKEIERRNSPEFTMEDLAARLGFGL
jgi:hypothetical protein